MEEVRIKGCVFEDTPKECIGITPDGNCLGLGKLQCMFNHIHLIIAEDAKTELMELFKDEINSERRYKHLSGLAGRMGQEK